MCSSSSIFWIYLCSVEDPTGCAWIYVFFIPLYFCSTCFECYLHSSSGAQTVRLSQPVPAPMD
jgi:hypothetical protein